MGPAEVKQITDALEAIVIAIYILAFVTMLKR